MESHPQNPAFRNNPENFHPRVCEIEFVHMGKNSANPDLVCEKHVSIPVNK